MPPSIHVPPSPRNQIFDLYWYFASERQQIFERRVAGHSGPWTKDPILQTFKFCNVFRAADRVSQYLIRNVAYTPSDSIEDLFFRIIAFRFFSKIETWEHIRSFLGRDPVVTDLSSGAFLDAINSARESQSAIYTSAFILCATNAYGFDSKHLNHIELFKEMFLRQEVAHRLADATSLESIYQLLHSFPLIGDFMAYQLAIDLNYSGSIHFSENDCCKAGPGAQRGLKKVFTDLGSYSPEDAIQWMVEHQTHAFESRSLPFHGLFGRPLHAIDCQGLFCEVDKYCREAAPELASNRKRIKTKFERDPQPIELFFPPKWGLNSEQAELR